VQCIAANDKIFFQTLLVKDENESAWQLRILIQIPRIGRQDVQNKNKFYAQMFTCKLFLSGPVELVLIIVCKTLKVLRFVEMQNTIFCYNEFFLNFQDVNKTNY